VSVRRAFVEGRKAVLRRAKPKENGLWLQQHVEGLSHAIADAVSGLQ
jgi:hypothetical protein